MRLAVFLAGAKGTRRGLSVESVSEIERQTMNPRLLVLITVLVISGLAYWRASNLISTYEECVVRDIRGEDAARLPQIQENCARRYQRELIIEKAAIFQIEGQSVRIFLDRITRQNYLLRGGSFRFSAKPCEASEDADFSPVTTVFSETGEPLRIALPIGNVGEPKCMKTVSLNVVYR